jgi:ribosomal protein S18 acetylase RimI-like enzyme
MNTVKILLESDSPALEQLWRDIEREEHPGDSDAGERAVRGSRRSLSEFDFLSSDSFWMFASEADHRCVGYASAARIPKADARVGFLFIDELYVLSAYRRQGHATRILEAVAAHARNLGLGGIRLLVDPANAAARRVYDRLRFAERSQILCEREI